MAAFHATSGERGHRVAGSVARARTRAVARLPSGSVHRGVRPCIAATVPGSAKKRRSQELMSAANHGLVLSWADGDVWTDHVPRHGRSVPSAAAPRKRPPQSTGCQARSPAPVRGPGHRGRRPDSARQTRSGSHSDDRLRGCLDTGILSGAALCGRPGSQVAGHLTVTRAPRAGPVATVRIGTQRAWPREPRRRHCGLILGTEGRVAACDLGVPVTEGAAGNPPLSDSVHLWLLDQGS
jgi:hypothetical protein